MKLCRTALIACLLPAMASCTVAPQPPTSGGPSYTCCEAADIDREYQPGQSLTLHWIVVPGQPGAAGPTRQFELRAQLAGPFATVGELRSSADPAGGATFTAAPVSPAGQPGENPVSVIQIPATAAPGMYNLVTSVTEQSGSVSGSSIIRVVPKP